MSQHAPYSEISQYFKVVGGPIVKTSRSCYSPLVFKVFLYSFLLCGVVIAPAYTQSIRIELGQDSREVSIEELKSVFELESFTTKNPAYENKDKTYVGFNIQAVVQHFFPASSENYQVTCADGYQPMMSKSEVLRSKGLIAIGELDEEGKLRYGFEKIKSKGKSIDPGSFYIVWRDSRLYPRVWPFQVVALKATSEFEFKSSEKGASLFRIHCQHCHPINGVGGKVGPELVRPKNITSYFKRSTLAQYVLDWRSVRETSGDERMPIFNSTLEQQDVEMIIDFISSQKSKAVN